MGQVCWWVMHIFCTALLLSHISVVILVHFNLIVSTSVHLIYFSPSSLWSNWSISVYFGPFGPIGPLQSIQVHFVPFSPISPFRSIQPIPVQFGPIGPFQSTLVPLVYFSLIGLLWYKGFTSVKFGPCLSYYCDTFLPLLLSPNFFFLIIIFNLEMILELGICFGLGIL